MKDRNQRLQRKKIEIKDFSEIRKAVDDLGHLASPYYLGELGWTDEEISEAVAAGALRWVSNGDLRTTESFER